MDYTDEELIAQIKKVYGLNEEQATFHLQNIKDTQTPWFAQAGELRGVIQDIKGLKVFT